MNLWRKPFDYVEATTSHGQVHIDTERCKGCSYCIEFCPRKVLKMGHQLNSKGYLLPVVDNESDCLHCGYCEVICPEFAIKVSTPSSSDS